MSNLLPVLALVAAALAAGSNDRLKQGDVLRKREKVVEGLSEEEQEAVDSVLRATETSTPNDEAAIIAEELAEHLPEDEGGKEYSADNPNGPHGNASGAEDTRDGQGEDQTASDSETDATGDKQ